MSFQQTLNASLVSLGLWSLSPSSCRPSRRKFKTDNIPHPPSRFQNAHQAERTRSADNSDLTLVAHHICILQNTLTAATISIFYEFEISIAIRFFMSTLYHI
jgi:hypothetical protein